MAIKEVITLEGVQEVEAGLARINKAGEDSLKSFRDLGSQATGGGFDKLVEGAKRAGLELQNSSRHTNTLREALHVLHPILQVAGQRAGELGSFARLAGTGLTGLAAAATGVIVVALATLEEQTNKTKAALSGLFGSKEAGNQAFNALEKAAQSLNTNVEGLAPAFQSATIALQRFQQTGQKFKFVALKPEDLPTGNIKETTAAVENLFKILRAGGQDSGEAQKSAKAFFDTMKEGGQLTAETLKQMDPAAIRLIAAAMGRGAETAAQFTAEVALTPIPINKLIERLAKFSEGAQKAFDANAVKSFKDEFDGLLRDLQKDFQDLFNISFSDFIITSLRQFRDDVKTIIADIRAAVEFVRAAVSPAGGAPVREAAVAEAEKLKQIKPFKLSDIFDLNIKPKITDAEKSVTELGDKTKEAAQVGTTAWADFSKSIDNITKTAVTAGDEMLQRFQQVQKTASTVKFVVPPGAEPLVPAATAEQQAAQTAAIVEQFRQAGVQAGAAFAESLKQTQLDFSAWITAVQQFGISAVSQAQQIYNQIKEIFAQPIQVRGQFSGFGDQFEGAPFAGGGRVRGRGTSTSDSNLAWLSANEWVINARAVQHYGSELFAALNSMRLPRDFIGRFNMGGLVRAMNSGNRMAGGGQVTATSGNRTLVLQLGEKKFSVTGKAKTINDLEREANLRNIASLGLAPNWVK